MQINLDILIIRHSKEFTDLFSKKTSQKQFWRLGRKNGNTY